jgi:thymidine phosphorylase
MTVVNLPSNKSKVVEKENGCFVWGSIKLSPADDTYPCGKSLDVDGEEGQMIASVLSKNLRQAPPMLLLTFL